MNLKQFAKIEATKAQGGMYFLLKSGKLIGGSSHRHILEKLFATEIYIPGHEPKYLAIFQEKECAIRIVFEEHKRLVVHVIACASGAQAKAISPFCRDVRARKFRRRGSFGRREEWLATRPATIAQRS